MIVNNLKDANCVIDLSEIALDKAESVDYNCFLVNKDKEILINKDDTENRFNITIYKPWSQLDRIGGDA